MYVQAAYGGTSVSGRGDEPIASRYSEMDEAYCERTINRCVRF